MKTMLGEYGKLVVLVLLLAIVLPVLSGTGEGSFIGRINNIRPAATLKDNDSFSLAESIFCRKPPNLSVKVKKLCTKQEYNLLDTEIFYIESRTAAGENAEVSVIKITDPGMNDITNEVAPEKFVPPSAGEYRVVYRAADSYHGSIKTTEKEYIFIAE